VNLLTFEWAQLVDMTFTYILLTGR